MQLLLHLLFSVLHLGQPLPSVDIDNDSYCILQLVGLECIETEGYMTPDAIYFIIGGQEWPSTRLSMMAGKYKDLEGYADVKFEDEIKVALWDDDTWDPDDFLGSVTIECRPDANGVARFTQDGANYKLSYRVK